MSFEIVSEINFLLATIFLGMVMTFLYDCLRIIRRVIRHNQWITSIEDFLYCCSCFILSFMLLYRENNGMIRWFSVVGVAIGMMIYKVTLSPLYTHYATRLLRIISGLLEKIIVYVNRPVKKCYIAFSRKGRTYCYFMKKKAKIMKTNALRRVKVIKLLVSHK